MSWGPFESRPVLKNRSKWLQMSVNGYLGGLRTPALRSCVGKSEALRSKIKALSFCPLPSPLKLRPFIAEPLFLQRPCRPA